MKREPRIFTTRTEAQRALLNEPGLRVTDACHAVMVCDEHHGIVWDSTRERASVTNGPWTEVLAPQRFGPWEVVERFEDADDAGTLRGTKTAIGVLVDEDGEWSVYSWVKGTKNVDWVRRWRL